MPNKEQKKKVKDMLTKELKKPKNKQNKRFIQALRNPKMTDKQFKD